MAEENFEELTTKEEEEEFFQLDGTEDIHTVIYTAHGPYFAQEANKEDLRTILRMEAIDTLESFLDRPDRHDKERIIDRVMCACEYTEFEGSPGEEDAKLFYQGLPLDASELYKRLIWLLEPSPEEKSRAKQLIQTAKEIQYYDEAFHGKSSLEYFGEEDEDSSDEETSEEEQA